MTASAAILANGLFQTSFGKTSHALVRGPSRFPLAGVVDPTCAGRDAGELLDGTPRGVPVFASLSALLESAAAPPEYCIVGVATPGGVLPPDLHAGLVEAAEAGLSLISGLHQLLADDADLAAAVADGNGRIIDLRRPRPTPELRFWSGEILQLSTPRVAVLGTDCAVGKRTTATLLRQGCIDAGIRAEMIYTGQTGWLLGIPHGFILDATPNDFVCGELEGAILACQADTDPHLILIEGQASLRNPSGPCGSELVISTDAAGVILQHAPKRRFFVDTEELRCEIPPVSEEIRLIELLGTEVWAVTLNQHRMTPGEAESERSRLGAELGLPVLLPLQGGIPALVEIVRRRLEPT